MGELLDLLPFPFRRDICCCRLVNDPLVLANEIRMCGRRNTLESEAQAAISLRHDPSAYLRSFDIRHVRRARVRVHYDA